VGNEAHTKTVEDLGASANESKLAAALAGVQFQHRRTRLSAGIDAAAQAKPDAASGQPHRRPVLVLVSNGIPHVPEEEREQEMRRLAAASQRWRATGGKAVVLGVITEERCHWLLAQLAQRLNGDLVLLRSGDEVEVQSALARIGRLAEQVRQGAVKATTPPTPIPHKGGIDRLSVLLLLAGLVCVGCLVVGFVQARRAREPGDPSADPEEREEAVIPPARWRITVFDRGEEGSSQGGRQKLLDEFDFTAADLRTDGDIDIGPDLTARVPLQGLGVWPRHLTVAAHGEGLILSVAPDALVKIDGREVLGPHREPQYLSSREITLGENDRFLLRLERVFDEMEGV